MPLTCPNCRRQLTVPNAKSGLQISCPGCQRTFVLGKPAPKAITAHDNIAEYGVQQEPTDRVLQEVGPPDTPQPQSKGKVPKLTAIEAVCMHCGNAAMFDPAFGGQRQECQRCGDPIFIPTAKQYSYALSQRRFWKRFIASLLLFFAGLIGFVVYLNYREGQTPPGAARRAWGESISPVLREVVSVDRTVEVASNGDLTIYRIEASNREKSKKLKINAPLVQVDSYVVMRGLTAVETVFTEGTSLDKLKQKHGIK